MPDGSVGKNLNVFAVAMSSSVHIDNNGKDIWILDKKPLQGLDGTTFTAEALYPIKLTRSGKKIVLSLHYSGSSSFLLVNATKAYQLKGKQSKIKDYALYLGNILKDFVISGKKKSRIKRSHNFFSVDFNSIDTKDILDIDKYLIKKRWYKTIFRLITNIVLDYSVA